MVSLRFPFSSFPPPGSPVKPASSSRRASFSPAAAATAVAGTVAAVGAAISQNPDRHPFVQNTLEFILSHLPSNLNPSPFWASLSLSSDAAPVVESKTGASFPPVIKDSQTLLGIGLRRKSIFGLKNIDVYAFGMPPFLCLCSDFFLIADFPMKWLMGFMFLSLSIRQLGLDFC